MIGDMNRYTQFQVANSLPVAAANEGGGGMAGIGVGLGAGLTMAQQMMNAMKPGEAPSLASGPAGASPPAGAGGAPAAGTKFCINCGHSIPRAAKFCAECGSAQQ
jgi:membrane protease subunit (stomatin/prohibitin family)